MTTSAESSLPKTPEVSDRRLLLSTFAGFLPRLEFFLALGAVSLSPLNTLRYSRAYFTLSDAFACACLGIMLVNRSIPFRPFGASTIVWFIGLVMLSGGLLLSSLVVGVPVRGLIVSAQYMFAYLAIPLIILGRSRRDTITLAKYFVLVITIVCLHGAYVVGVVGEVNTQYVSGNGRLLSFVQRENEAGALFAITLPLVLWLRETGDISRAAAILSFLLIAYGVTLTGSNTAALAGCYGALLYFIATASWRRAFTIAALGGVIIGTFLVAPELLPLSFQQRVLGAIESGDIDEAGTFVGRMNLMNDAIRIADTTTLMGLGADQFGQTNQFAQPVHNAYLLLWTEGGMPAFVGLILMLLGAFASVLVSLRTIGGWATAVCTFTVVSLFTLMINAFPHIYGRFFVVPLLLGMSISLNLRPVESAT